MDYIEGEHSADSFIYRHVNSMTTSNIPDNIFSKITYLFF